MVSIYASCFVHAACVHAFCLNAVSTAPAAGGGLLLLQLRHSITRSSVSSRVVLVCFKTVKLIWKRGKKCSRLTRLLIQ